MKPYTPRQNEFMLKNPKPTNSEMMQPLREEERNHLKNEAVKIFQEFNLSFQFLCIRHFVSIVSQLIYVTKI